MKHTLLEVFLIAGLTAGLALAPACAQTHGQPSQPAQTQAASGTGTQTAPLLFKRLRYGMNARQIRQLISSVRPCEQLMPQAGMPKGWLCNSRSVEFVGAEWTQVFVMSANGLNEVRLITESTAPALQSLLDTLGDDYIPVWMNVSGEVKDLFSESDEQRFFTEAYSHLGAGTSAIVTFMKMQDAVRIANNRRKEEVFFVSALRTVPNARTVTISHPGDHSEFLLIAFGADLYHEKHKIVRKEAF